ncbi:hypothetical protein EPUS_05434 [Endocarpon pusillum Z07020]|uniref:Uncharacterized protein n=1 Tax=Endocarpon pusillum (strain Z07020 / HMAS-L-300199) TaxID=1263415 RepID=U1FY96_ENDPU|nr:uncharacterized protein EPUS_05434 [Endocarpon pusillum Z07020]ERF69892.1 hypothetical protein EPUS_05434 [Endocarpon pusillum Z07020]
MERMRRLQWALATASFANSSLGRRSLDVLTMIFDHWKQHKDPEPGVRSPNDDWPKVDERHVPCLRLLRTCRYLYYTLKDDILGKAVIYFRTPDTIPSFRFSQELAPMTLPRPNYLHTVILDIRDNANWPLKTEVRGVTTSLPTNPVEWEARIKRFAPDSPGNNTLGRFMARGNKGLMTADWGHAIGRLLTQFAVKNLIVRGNRGFVTALAAGGPIVRNLVEARGCVENVTELGLWPARAQGALTRGMTLAQPTMANSKAFQVQARPHICPNCLREKCFRSLTSAELKIKGANCPACQTPTSIIVPAHPSIGNQHV